MLLNCRQLKHVYPTLRLYKIPCTFTNTTFSSQLTHTSLWRQPLLLLRRPHHHLFNVRPPAVPATATSRWTARLIVIRRCLSAKNTDKALAKIGTRKKKAPAIVRLGPSQYKRLLSLAKTEKITLIAGLACLIISSVITMSVPFFLGKVVDIVFNKSGIDEATLTQLGDYSLMLFGVFVIGGFANCARVYMFGSAALRMVRRLRSNLYRAMLMQEVGWFDTRGTGELINRLSNDTYFAGISLSQNVSDGLRSIAMISVGTIMMIYTSPKLALVSALVVPALAGMAIVYGRYVRRITRAELDKYAEVMKHAEERFGNVRTVKVFCREQKECEDLDRQLDEALAIGYKETKARSVFFGLTGFSGNFSIVSVLYYGGVLVLTDEITIGALTSFMLYAGYVGVALNGLSSFYSHLNKGVGAAERIWDILDRKYLIPIDSGIMPVEPPLGEVQFKNVHFSYPSRPDSNVLTNFSLTLLPHQTTAVVGRSGSGKSTVTMLLMRLYDPQQGAIYLDGVDVRTLNPQWLRHNVGAVSQEPVLFSGSIRDNILYGLHPSEMPNEDVLQKVVREAHVIEFTDQLPDGLETIVGQRGMLLSGGQKQRVAIARALIKNPTILVLDEATSALDAVSEQLVQSALENLIQGRTVCTIAHRLSTIHRADKIAVLEGGRIVEEGNYKELMSRPDGAFRELVSKQAFTSSSISKDDGVTPN